MIFYDAIILLLLLLGAIFALRTLKLVVRNQVSINTKFLLFLTLGIILLFLAQTSKLFFVSIGIIPNFLPQIILMLSQVLLIIAFASLWYNTSKVHRLSRRDRIFFLGVLSFLILGVFLLIHSYLGILGGLGVYGFLSALNLCLVALIFLLTYPIQSRIKAGVADSSLKYFSSGMFIYLLARLLDFYIQFGPGPQWLEVIYTFLMLIALAYFIFGFMVVRKKASVIVISKSIVLN